MHVGQPAGPAASCSGNPLSCSSCRCTCHGRSFSGSSNLCGVGQLLRVDAPRGFVLGRSREKQDGHSSWPILFGLIGTIVSTPAHPDPVLVAIFAIWHNSCSEARPYAECSSALFAPTDWDGFEWCAPDYP